MNTHHLYMTFWGSACLIAFSMLIKKRNTGNIKKYAAFLAQPWRVVTFLISGGGITLIAPYTGDFTWDYVDGAVISTLVYISSPWAVGTIYRKFKRQSSWGDVYVALCLMLFSSSWFYDGYIYLRNGFYPATWFSNLIISPAFYITAEA